MLLWDLDLKILCCKAQRHGSVKFQNYCDSTGSGNSHRRSEIISQSFAKDETDQDIAIYPKTKEDENLIREAVMSNEFLHSFLHGTRLKPFIDCMYSQKVTEGEYLIRQGEFGSHLYISVKGTYEVSAHEKIVHTFNDIRVFGELAILYSAKRFATVRSLENGLVWVLDCRTFKQLTIKSAVEEQEELVKFLMNVPKLNTTSKEKLYQVANLFKTEFFIPSREIIRQCELGHKFYLIRAGTVTVEKDTKAVATLTKGNYFGELALLQNEFRQATVTADPPGVECLTLTAREFIDHFGDIEDFIKVKLLSLTSITQSCKNPEFTNLELEDLNVLQTIGVGAYGRVQLVQHKHQKNLVFVLKHLKKCDISTKSHQTQVFNEKNLQMACQSPFLIRMHRTYKTSKHLYFLLEACLGGDLWNLMRKQKKRCFDEDSAKFYSGCVLEGLSYLHDLGIIYRDLKPENMIVHHNGYLKLADFGFAKKTDTTEKTYTFVGTAEYLAPEIILNKGYNKGVDYWAFGVFIYELLVGRTPFRCKESGHLGTYKLILRGIDFAVFPAYVPKRAKLIIKKLCKSFSSDRLGCLRGGITSIRTHPWYENFDWEKLRTLELESPYKPALDNNVDTRHFEKFKEDDIVPEDDFSEWDEKF